MKVDPDTSMKRYIQRSVPVMAAGLESAVNGGPGSTDGLRDMGAALHILEDFFAHSNFAELSLIKLGHERILPWTSEADCKHRLPLVTGTFGGSDIIASLAEPLGRIMFSTDEKPFEAIKAGERYERDQIIQIVLGEHLTRDCSRVTRPSRRARPMGQPAVLRTGRTVLRFHRYARAIAGQCIRRRHAKSGHLARQQRRRPADPA